MARPKKITGGRRKAIPPELLEALLVEAGKGLTLMELERWLLETHGVKADHRTVGKHLKAIREERAEAARGAVADRVAKSATADLDVLAGLQADLLGLWNKHKRGKSVRDALQVADRLHWVTATKLKAAGIGTDVPAPTQDARAELLASMRRLAATD